MDAGLVAALALMAGGAGFMAGCAFVLWLVRRVDR